MDKKGHYGKRRDHPDSRLVALDDAPGLRPRLASWLGRWGVDTLLTAGALLVSAGAGWIYPPAGLITGGVLLIVGGILWARGKGGYDP